MCRRVGQCVGVLPEQIRADPCQIVQPVGADQVDRCGTIHPVLLVVHSERILEEAFKVGSRPVKEKRGDLGVVEHTVAQYLRRRKAKIVSLVLESVGHFTPAGETHVEKQVVEMVGNRVGELADAHLVAVITVLYVVLSDRARHPVERIGVGQISLRDGKPWMSNALSGDALPGRANLSLMVILESGRAVIVAGGKPARTVRGEHHPVPFVGGELFLDESQHRAEGGGGRCDGLLAEHLEGVGDHFPFRGLVDASEIGVYRGVAVLGDS